LCYSDQYMRITSPKCRAMSTHDTFGSNRPRTLYIYFLELVALRASRSDSESSFGLPVDLASLF
jgi:hypothetical protein